MILTIDIGNTNITCGIFQGKKLLRTFSIPTKGVTQTKLVKILTKGSDPWGLPVDLFWQAGLTPIICSVVPRVTPIVSKAVKKVCGRAPKVIGKSLRIPFKTKYKEKKKLGQDRIVAMIGALSIVKPPLVIFDFGTALTCDYINRRGVHEGGLIIPGMETALHALGTKTQLLPKNLKIQKTRTFLGRQTKDCMRSGIIYGYFVLTQGLIQQFKKQYGKNLTIIFTGGEAAFVKTLIKTKVRLMPQLTLRGLATLALKQI